MESCRFGFLNAENINVTLNVYVHITGRIYSYFIYIYTLNLKFNHKPILSEIRDRSIILSYLNQVINPYSNGNKKQVPKPEKREHVRAAAYKSTILPSMMSPLYRI